VLNDTGKPKAARAYADMLGRALELEATVAIRIARDNLVAYQHPPSQLVEVSRNACGSYALWTGAGLV